MSDIFWYPSQGPTHIPWIWFKAQIVGTKTQLNQIYRVTNWALIYETHMKVKISGSFLPSVYCFVNIEWRRDADAATTALATATGDYDDGVAATVASDHAVHGDAGAVCKLWYFSWSNRCKDASARVNFKIYFMHYLYLSIFQVGSGFAV